MGFGLGVWGLGISVQGLGFRAWVLGYGISAALLVAYDTTATPRSATTHGVSALQCLASSRQPRKQKTSEIKTKNRGKSEQFRCSWNQSLSW